MARSGDSKERIRTALQELSALPAGASGAPVLQQDIATRAGLSYGYFKTVLRHDRALRRDVLHLIEQIREQLRVADLAEKVALVRDAIERLRESARGVITQRDVAAVTPFSTQELSVLKRQSPDIRRLFEKVSSESVIQRALLELRRLDRPVTVDALAVASGVSRDVVRRCVPAEQLASRDVYAETLDVMHRAVAEAQTEGVSEVLYATDISARLGISARAFALRRQRHAGVALMHTSLSPERVDDDLEQALGEAAAAGNEGVSVEDWAQCTGFSAATIQDRLARNAALTERYAAVSTAAVLDRVRLAAEELRLHHDMFSLVELAGAADVTPRVVARSIAEDVDLRAVTAECSPPYVVAHLWAVLKSMAESVEVLTPLSVAQHAGYAIRTLERCAQEHPTLAARLKAVSPEAVDAAIIEGVNELLHTRDVVSPSDVAAMLGLRQRTVEARARSNAVVRSVLREASPYALKARVEHAVDHLKGQSDVIDGLALCRELQLPLSAVLRVTVADEALAGKIARASPGAIDGLILDKLAQLQMNVKDVITDADLCARTGLRLWTLVSRRVANPRVARALYRASLDGIDDRIVDGIEEVHAERFLVSMDALVEASGLRRYTLERRRRECARVRESFARYAPTSARERLLAGIERLRIRGIREATQHLIAEECGLSDSAVSWARRHDPLMRELMEQVLLPSTYDRLVDAADALAAREESVTLSMLADEAGVSIRTVHEYVKDERFRDQVLSSLRLRERRRFPDLASVEREYRARIERYGTMGCCRPSSLRQSRAERGDLTFLKACLQFGFALPEDTVYEYDPVAATYREMTAREILTTDEVDDLWALWRGGDAMAYDELLRGLQPLIVFVLEEELCEDILVASGTAGADRVLELLAEGQLVLAEALRDESMPGGVMPYVRNRLSKALWERRRLYRYEQQGIQYDSSGRSARVTSMDATREGPDGGIMPSAGISGGDSMQPRGPDEVVGATGGELTFGEEALIERRDRHSGRPVILRGDKIAVSHAVGEMFKSAGVPNGVLSDVRWALFTTGSLGRLGTAIRGACDWNGVMIVDAPAARVQDALERIGAQLDTAVELRDDGCGGTLKLAATEKRYRALEDRILSGTMRGLRQITQYGDDAGDALLEHLYALMSRFTIGGAERGLGSLTLISLPALVQVPRGLWTGDRITFEVQRNGFLATESATGIGEQLCRLLVARARALGVDEFMSARLRVEEEFLRTQRTHLEQ